MTINLKRSDRVASDTTKLRVFVIHVTSPRTYSIAVAPIERLVVHRQRERAQQDDVHAREDVEVPVPRERAQAVDRARRGEETFERIAAVGIAPRRGARDARRAMRDR